MRKNNYKKGFSMMEVVFSSFILVVGLVAILTLVSKSLKYSLDNRDTIISTNLAQEGVELVRNMRDNNLARSQAAFCSSDPCPREFESYSSFKNDFVIDTDTGVTSVNLTDGAPKRLFLKDGIYNHDNSGTTQTKFFRKIMQIPYPNSSSQVGLKFVSVVTWTGDDTLLKTINKSNYSNSCTTLNKCTYVENILTGENS